MLYSKLGRITQLVHSLYAYLPKTTNLHTD